ncbi:MAG: squalene synthase HpnC [Planctomycetales bacterium]|nr:squalene synthase HpnC [Planctomycetales bacterium]
MRQSATSTTSTPLDFSRELARYGPEQAGELGPRLAAHYCRTWATGHYENFTVVSLLLPRRYRQDFANLYAFCRWSDNLADEIPDPRERARLLDWWQSELDRCFAGRARHPVLLALQSTVARYDLDKEPFADLLSAFRQDQAVFRYETHQQLEAYCLRSAAPVGRILLHMAGVHEQEARPMSDQICIGLQLANFCQDMARDAKLGRIYAPGCLWEVHGVTEEMLLAGQCTAELQSLLGDWVARGREQLLQGWPLLNMVPRWLQASLDLFVRGGLEILQVIERAEWDVWTCRPTLSKWTKGRLVARSLWARSFLSRRLSSPACDGALRPNRRLGSLTLGPSGDRTEVRRHG